MKKLVITIIASSLIFTSCNKGPNKKINPLEPKEDNKRLVREIKEYDTDKLESNINYNSIKDDYKITEKIQNNYDMTLNKVKDFNENTLTTRLNDYNLKEVYDKQIPKNINVDILYNKYDIPFTYAVIKESGKKIYGEPNIRSRVIAKPQHLSKLKLEGKVGGFANKDWYVISWTENGVNIYGYIPTDIAWFRTFQFDKMISEIERLDSELGLIKYGYISNYKNKNGSAPLLNGKSTDEHGIQAYQSAPAYPNIENKESFRYIPDGMIVSILDENKEYFKVTNFEYEGEYWVPKQYVSFEDNISNLEKVVVVDTTNQNQAVFEKRNDKWTIISYTLATTGAKEKHKFETPKGRFKVQEKRDRFYYLNDETKELAGYAPYATRFTAGAYIHGVPIDFQKKDGEKIDPGMKEYLATIGTTPRSHKCVRNYTSHAKFVYDWIDTTKSAVIVID